MGKTKRVPSRTRLYGEQYTKHMQGLEWHRERLATGYVDDGVWATCDDAGEVQALLLRVGFGWMLRLYSPAGSWHVTEYGPYSTADEAAHYCAASLGYFGPVAA